MSRPLNSCHAGCQWLTSLSESWLSLDCHPGPRLPLGAGGGTTQQQRPRNGPEGTASADVSFWKTHAAHGEPELPTAFRGLLREAEKPDGSFSTGLVEFGAY